MPIGGKYKAVKHETPGPGQYASADPAPASRGGKIGTQVRRDPFDATKKAAADQPGPGNYGASADLDTFGKGKALGFGSKYKDKKSANPGPGQYDADKNRLKAQPTSVKMGTTQRADLWGADKQRQEATPGPGNFGDTYSSFNTGKGVPFGGKYKAVQNTTPGPGSYQAAKSKAVVGNAKIGTSKRADLWNSTRTAKDGAPGPADFGDNYSSFKTGKGAVIGGKYKDKPSDTPGPGQY